MKQRQLLAVCLFCLFNFFAAAQDTLPKFTVREISKGKVQVSWINTFDKLVQLTVQRSFDSTKFFRTIFSSQSPWLPQNGFVDNNAVPGYKMFYRILYVFEGGSYFFTTSKSPSVYVPIKVIPVTPPDEPEKINPVPTPIPTPVTPEKRMVKIYKRTKDTLITEIEFKEYKRFKDSVNKNTKDTVVFNSDDDEAIIKPYIPKPVWKPSTYIFTNDKGYVKVILPLAKQKRYRILFFEESGTELFEIKHVKEPELLLDKTNFIRAGWFLFELYEDDKLKEKNKFYLWKD
jgi:hypothetical protein